MKSLILLFLVGVCRVTAVTHSLTYFYTASSGIPNFPEFVTVGMVDELQIDHYDSNTRRAQSKQDWMKEIIADDPQYLDRTTGLYAGHEPIFKDNINFAKQRFNQTGDVHVFQLMYGCEWDDETQEVTGYAQYGYDGEDFISFDLKTKTWIAPTPQAVITKHKWDSDKDLVTQTDKYLSQLCPQWVKKYVDYGWSSLMRTVRPSVSIHQKTPSSSVSCHATGFYPHRALIFWTKDGEEVHEDVYQGEILPNHDGTFQMSVDLDVSSVKAEDRRRYDCVFQLSGVKDDIVTKLEESESGEFPLDTVLYVTGAVLCVGVIGFIIWMKYKRQRAFRRANRRW